MRYIADSSGYVKEVSFGADIVCDGQVCTEYTGNVPAGYASLEAWFIEELEKLYRWKIVGGNLTLDSTAEAPRDKTPEEILADLGGVSITKLWENASPTSAFAAQTINLDLSEYDFILIEVASNPTWEIIKIGNAKAVCMAVGIRANGSAVFRDRQFTVSSTGVAATAAYYKTASSTTANVDNTNIIPTRIYGIKGVQ